MKISFQIILIIFVCPILTYSQIPKNFEPDYISPFAWQLPFTESEIATFKMAKIRTIKYFVGNNSFTDFEFSESGQLISEQNYNLSNSSNAYNKKILSETIYKYNKSGQLIYSEFKNKEYENIDSITYNDEGRIIGYYSYSMVKIKTKYQKRIHFDTKFLRNENDNIVLTDTSSHWKGTTFTIDKANKLIKTKWENHLDSLSFEIDTNGLNHIKRWREGYHIESIYQNGLIIEKTIKDDNLKYYDPYSLKTVYNYNMDKRLTSITHKTHEDDITNKMPNNFYFPEIFYTYNYLGLLKERITISQGYQSKDLYMAVPNIRIEQFAYY